MMGWMAPLRHRRAKLVFWRITRNREPSMSEITTIGLDLAKHVFQVHGIDAKGTTVLRKRLRRGQVLAFFSRSNTGSFRSRSPTRSNDFETNVYCRGRELSPKIKMRRSGTAACTFTLTGARPQPECLPLTGCVCIKLLTSVFNNALSGPFPADRGAPSQHHDG
jgi:hypothetical protein